MAKIISLGTGKVLDAFEALLLHGEAETQQVQTNLAAETVTGNFIIIDYSEKALAVFGNTRQIKDQLKELGGRFNPKLTHEGQKKAGWIFSKSKENELNNLLISI